MSLSFDQLGLVHANGYRALKGVSLSVTTGERVAIICCASPRRRCGQTRVGSKRSG